MLEVQKIMYMQAVPYADPHPPFHRKCAFDVGDCKSLPFQHPGLLKIVIFNIM